MPGAEKGQVGWVALGSVEIASPWGVRYNKKDILYMEKFDLAIISQSEENPRFQQPLSPIGRRKRRSAAICLQS